MLKTTIHLLFTFITITKAKAKEFSFMVKAKAKTLDFHTVFKDTSRPRPRLRTKLLAELHPQIFPRCMYGMPARTRDEKGVRLSVCQTRGL